MSDPRISPQYDVSVFAAQRADAMLPALQRELSRGVRRRRGRSRALGACAILLLLGGAIVAAMLTSRPIVAPTLPPPIVEAPDAPVGRPTVSIEVVRSMDAPLIEVVRDAPRDSLVQFYATASVDLASISVTDQELLDLLNAIGRPTGLVRANGRVWLTAAVTDDEIAKQRGG